MVVIPKPITQPKYQGLNAALHPEGCMGPERGGCQGRREETGVQSDSKEKWQVRLSCIILNCSSNIVNLANVLKTSLWYSLAVYLVKRALLEQVV